jgi:hypothetical protein
MFGPQNTFDCNCIHFFNFLDCKIKENLTYYGLLTENE